MALFRNLETRYINVHGKRTSIALEPAFWLVAEQQASDRSMMLNEWLREALRGSQGNRASWVRVAILKGLIDNQKRGSSNARN